MNKGIQKDSWIGVGAILLLMIWSISLLLFALLSGAEASEGYSNGIEVITYTPIS